MLLALIVAVSPVLGGLTADPYPSAPSESQTGAGKAKSDRIDGIAPSGSAPEDPPVILATEMTDTFPSTTWDAAKWSSQTTAIDTGCGSVSSPNSMHLEGLEEAITVAFDFSTATSGSITFQLRKVDVLEGTPACDVSEAGDETLVYYCNPCTPTPTWICLAEFEIGVTPSFGCTTFVGSITAGWFSRSVTLPSGAMFNGVKFRFLSSGTATDDWGVDDVTITTQRKPNAPTLATPWDNQRSGEWANPLRPEFTFSTADAEGNDVRYNLEADDDPLFGSLALNVVSGTDAGFTDVTNGADTDPFASGDTIKFAAQSDLSSGTTYWWRVRALDPTGSNSYSPYSSTRSVTVLSGASAQTWFQTTAPQFARDTLGAGTTAVETGGGALEGSVVIVRDTFADNEITANLAWTPGSTQLLFQNTEGATTGWTNTRECDVELFSAGWLDSAEGGAAYQRSPTTAFWIDDVADTTPDLFDNATTYYLTSPSVTIPAGSTSPQLKFWHRMNSEGSGFDHGWLEYSVAGGAWTDAVSTSFASGGYNTDPAASTYCGSSVPPSTASSDVWNGAIALSQVTMIIPAAAIGTTFQWRYFFRTDTLTVAGGFDGWWVDDIEVTISSTSPAAWLGTNGYLESTGIADSLISTPVTVTATAPHCWEMGFQHESNTATNSIFRFFPMVTAADPVLSVGTTGYYLFSNTANGAYNFIKQNNATTTTIITNTWVEDTNWHKAKVCRTSAGVWTIFRDDVQQGVSATDTYTAGMNYMGLRNGAGAVTSNTHHDNIYMNRTDLTSGQATSTAIKYADGPAARSSWEQVVWTPDTSGGGSVTTAVQRNTAADCSASWTWATASSATSPISLSALGTVACIRLVANFTFAATTNARISDWAVSWSTTPAPTNSAFVIRHAASPIADGGNLFAGRTDEELEVRVSDPQGTSNLATVDLRLDGTVNFLARWTEASDSFSEVAGGSEFDILSTSADTTPSGNQWTIVFKIKFLWTMTWADVAKDPVVFSTDDNANTDLDTFTANTYTVDNDLVFTGSLTVYRGAACSGSLVSAGSWVLGSQQLHWCGLNTRYQVDTSVTPPDSDFDLRITSDNPVNFDQTTGAGLATTLNADATLDISDIHSVSIINVPGGGPHGTTTFEIKVDPTDPDAPVSLAAVPASWTATNSFSLSWSAPGNEPGGASSSGVAGSKYKRCPTVNTDCSVASTADFTGTGGVGSLAGITVPSGGRWYIRVWLLDVVGNEAFGNNAVVSVYLDSNPPATPVPSTPIAYQQGGLFTNPLRPEFQFSSADAEGNDIRYQVQLSTDKAFGSTVNDSTSSATNWGCGVAFKEFCNTQTSGDDEPFASGQVVKWTVGANLGAGTTYWWRVRAWNVHNPGAQSAWSGVRSITVSATSAIHSWFQTTQGQFQDDTLASTSATAFGGGAVEVATSPIISSDTFADNEYNNTPVWTVGGGSNSYGDTTGSSTFWTATMSTVVSTYGPIGSTGTVTSWSVYNWQGAAFSAKLKIFRDAGANLNFVGQSSVESVPAAAGTYTYSTSIAVLAGDYIGVWGNPGYMGAIPGSFTTWYKTIDESGNTAKTSWTSNPSYRVAVSVVVSVPGGTWSAASGYLASTATAESRISTPTGLTMSSYPLSWEFRWKHEAMDAGDSQIRFYLASNSATVASTGVNGFYFTASTIQSGAPLLQYTGIVRQDGAPGPFIIGGTNFNWVPNGGGTGWNTGRVTRTAAGFWSLTVNGASIGTTTDVTYPSGNTHIGLRNTAADVNHNAYIDDIYVNRTDLGTGSVRGTVVKYADGPAARTFWSRIEWTSDLVSGGAVTLAVEKNAASDCSGAWSWAFETSTTPPHFIGELNQEACIRLVSNLTFPAKLLDWTLFWSIDPPNPTNDDLRIYLAGDAKAHWRFEEGSGTSAFDASGNGNTGTLTNGPVYSTGTQTNYASFRALDFDGVNDHVLVPNSASISPTSSLTVSGWFYTDSLGSIDGSWVSKRSSYILHPTASGAVYFYVYVSGTWQSVNTPAPAITLGTWEHWAGTYDGSTLRIYENGVQSNSAPLSGAIGTSGDLYIGADVGCACGSRFFDGRADEVRIYDRALAAVEVASLAGTGLADGAPLFADLTAEFVLKVSDPNGPSNLATTDLRLDGTSSYIARWTRSGDVFSEAAGGAGFDLLSTIYDSNSLNMQWTIVFRVKFLWTLAWADSSVDPVTNSLDAQSNADTDTFLSRTYTVDNDLVFTGSLTVYKNTACSGATVTAGDWMAGGTQLRWCGLSARYQADTTMIPFESVYDFQVDDDDSDASNDKWSQTSGATMSIQSWADNATDVSDNVIVSILVPAGGGPHGSQAFLIKVDASPPSSPISLAAVPVSWSAPNSFTLSWTNPAEQSGVASSKYKRCLIVATDCTVASGADTTGTGGASSIPVITAPADGVWYVHVWLVDNVGNELYTSNVVTTIMLDATGPGYTTFEVWTAGAWQPVTSWVSENQTPWFRVTISAPNSGIDVSSIQYEYSTNGGGAWSGWTGSGLTAWTCAAMSGCAASNGATGTLYLKLTSVPFNQISGTQNLLHVRAQKMTGAATLTTSASQFAKIDNAAPTTSALDVWSPGTSTWVTTSPAPWVTTQTPILRITAGVGAAGSGIQLSTTQYRYSTNGGSSWSGWLALPGGSQICTNPNVDAPCTAAPDGTLNTVYVKVNGVPFGQDSETQNQVQVRVGKVNGLTITTAVMTISIDSLPPTTPGSFALDFKSAVTVRLRWTPPVEVRFNHFDVCYSTSTFTPPACPNLWNNVNDPDLGGPWPANKFDIYANATTVTGLAIATTYYFRLRAVDESGGGSPYTSPEVIVTTNSAQSTEWTLRSGDNLVGFWTTKTGGGEWTAKALGAAITTSISSQQGSAFATRIRWYDASTQSWGGEVTCGAGCTNAGNWAGADFPIVHDGRGHWIVVTGVTGSVTFQSADTEIISPISLTLREGGGYHVLTIPFTSRYGYTGQTLTQLIRDQNIGAGKFTPSSGSAWFDPAGNPQSIEVRRWNPSTLQFDSVLYYYDEFAGAWAHAFTNGDFLIVPGESYVIRLQTIDNLGSAVVFNP